MRRMMILAMRLFVAVAVPTVSEASYHGQSARQVNTVARPIRGGNWKANVGSLRTYDRAGQVHASRTVGSRLVQYAPSKVTIQSLLAQRALNPARFDLIHKDLGRLLARDERLRAAGISGPYHGLLYPSARHNYLRWRWGLNPPRFNHYHPVLGAILTEDNRLKNLVVIKTNVETVTPPVNTPSTEPSPPGGIPSGNGGSGGTDTPMVPEPASIILLAAGTALLGLLHTRRFFGRRRKSLYC